MKLTEWCFDKTPKRKGVYQVLTYGGSNRQNYSFWDGEWWGMLGESPAEAFYSRKFKHHFMARHIWRGLAEKP